MRKLTKEEKLALEYIKTMTEKGMTVLFGRGNYKLSYSIVKRLHDLGAVRMNEYMPRAGVVWIPNRA